MNNSFVRRVMQVELPCANRLKWAIWRHGDMTLCATSSEVLADLKSWHPYHKVLVAAPGENWFSPPIFHRALRVDLMIRLKRQAEKMLMLLHVALLLFVFMLIYRGGRNLELTTMLLVVTLVGHWSDYHVLQSIRNVAERATFFYRLSSSDSYRRSFAMCVVMALITGCVQMLLVLQFGDIDSVVRAYGAYFPAITQGEYWRILFGPFVHSGYIHWMQNAFMCALLVPVLSSLFGVLSTLMCFLLGNTIGLISVMYFTRIYDAYLGVSAGAHTLASMLLIVLIAKAKYFPRGLWVLLLCLLVADYLIAAMNPVSSMIAHLFGDIVGLLIGGILLPRLKFQ